MKSIFLSILACFFVAYISFAFADTGVYVYENVEGLTATVNGNNAGAYDYDNVENTVTATNRALTTSAPFVSSIVPGVLLPGIKTTITISGENLLTTQSISSVSGKTSILKYIATGNSVTAEVIASSVGNDTLQITNTYGSCTTPQITAVASALVLNPAQLSLLPGTTGTIAASFNPSLAQSVTIALPSSDPAIATTPATVTIPAGGTSVFAVNAVKEGVSFIPSKDAPVAEIFVENPQSKSTTSLSNAVSISFNQLPPGFITVTSNSVSIAFDPPPLSSYTVGSNSVCVAFDIQPLSSYTGPGGANGVSVSFDPDPGKTTVISNSVTISFTNP